VDGSDDVFAGRRPDRQRESCPHGLSLLRDNVHAPRRMDFSGRWWYRPADVEPALASTGRPCGVLGSGACDSEKMRQMAVPPARRTSILP
jgi:hypothetical protein